MPSARSSSALVPVDPSIDGVDSATRSAGRPSALSAIEVALIEYRTPQRIWADKEKKRRVEGDREIQAAGVLGEWGKRPTRGLHQGVNVWRHVVI